MVSCSMPTVDVCDPILLYPLYFFCAGNATDFSKNQKNDGSFREICRLLVSGVKHKVA
jgi:hypothetical protein